MPAGNLKKTTETQGPCPKLKGVCIKALTVSWPLRFHNDGWPIVTRTICISKDLVPSLLTDHAAMSKLDAARMANTTSHHAHANNGHRRLWFPTAVGVPQRTQPAHSAPSDHLPTTPKRDGRCRAPLCRKGPLIPERGGPETRARRSRRRRERGRGQAPGHRGGVDG